MRVHFDSISRCNRVGGSICFSLCSLTGDSCFHSMFKTRRYGGFDIMIIGVGTSFLTPIFFSSRLIVRAAIVRLKRGDFAVLRHTFGGTDKILGYRYHAMLMKCSGLAGRPVRVPRSCGRTVYSCRNGALDRLSRPLRWGGPTIETKFLVFVWAGFVLPSFLPSSISRA